MAELKVLGEIDERHPQDVELFELYGQKTIEEPDIIIKDKKNEGTVFMIKRLSDCNINVVVRLALETEDEGLKNSVMTFYRIRKRNLVKLLKKNKEIYRKEII